MGKSQGNQTVTNNLDPATAAMQGDIYAAARRASQGANIPSVDPLTNQAIQQYGGFANAGQAGLSALGGNAQALGNFFNPYQQQVLDRVAGQWGDLSHNVMNSVDDAATKAHAFGGSRHGVAEGVALQGLAKDQANQMAALTYQGYNDAQQRAAQVAQLGYGATGQLNQLGEYNRQVAMQTDPLLQQLNILKSGVQGVPYGTSSTQTGSPGKNGAAGFLGGAASGAGIAQALGLATPWGAAAAGLGGVLGMF